MSFWVTLSKYSLLDQWCFTLFCFQKSSSKSRMFFRRRHSRRHVEGGRHVGLRGHVFCEGTEEDDRIGEHARREPGGMCHGRSKGKIRHFQKMWKKWKSEFYCFNAVKACCDGQYFQGKLPKRAIFFLWNFAKMFQWSINPFHVYDRTYLPMSAIKIEKFLSKNIAIDGKILPKILPSAICPENIDRRNKA